VAELERTGRPPAVGLSKLVERDVDEDLAAQVRQLKTDRKIIEAIKLVRQRTGLGLKDAKDVVDAL
jgi:large subunit ribosomal protein L7/L12